MDIPRPEYPRPQLARREWLCLNGPWQFEIDPADTGLERGLLNRELQGKIVVPFCPESELSGVGNRDFMPAVWYRKVVDVPKEWAGRRVLLHFQAVDYDATVWVNGKEVARHRGGFTPFTCDLSGVVSGGERATIVVRARDDARQNQPKGKQCPEYANYGCLYTRTTGIWQTVWMEPVGEAYLLRPRFTADLANWLVRLEQPIRGRSTKGLVLRARLLDDAGVVSEARCEVKGMAAMLDLPVPETRRRLWSPGDGQLYRVELELSGPDGRTLDRAESYFGMRSLSIDGPAILVNGRPVFQRLVLDQGYYPDGILTAPTDEALVRDIQLAMEAGFNGARLHQKVFEERFLYHADRLGYMVWGEFPDWGCGGFGPEHDHQRPGPTYITQWLEVLERDYSHPCIVGWCPLNETWQVLTDRITVLDDVTRGMFLAAKVLDPTRPVLDASGYSHRVRESDVYDCHDYEQDVRKFASNYAGLAQGRPFVNMHGSRPMSVEYRGQPFFVSEFGGIWWNPDAKPGQDSWGYGERPKTIEEFYARFEGLTRALLENPHMFGYCYTQLTDVYQEQNGIYTFDRRRKFDMQRIRAAQLRPAAIERAKP